MDDLLSSIRRIMAEEEADPRRPAPSRREDPFPVHAKRNEEVPVELSPSDADRLPELVERSIMNAFAGNDEGGADEVSAAAHRNGHASFTGTRVRSEEEDSAAAMATIADAIAREFSGADAGGTDRDEGRLAPSMRPYTLSEPGLDGATLEDFDEAEPDDAADSVDAGSWMAGEPAAAPSHRSAAARLSNLKGRLEPRAGDTARDAYYRPRAEVEPEHTRSARASAPRAREGDDGPAASTAAAVSGDAQEAPQDPPYGAYAAPQHTPQANASAWDAGALPHDNPATPGAPQPDPLDDPAGGNVFRRSGARRVPPREPVKFETAQREASNKEVAQRAEAARETAQRQLAEHHERDAPERQAPVAGEWEHAREAGGVAAARADEDLTSTATRQSIQLALEELSRTLLPQTPRTLEDLVREMMRPMLREWMEANLATIVEETVRQEIARATARRT